MRRLPPLLLGFAGAAPPESSGLPRNAYAAVGEMTAGYLTGRISDFQYTLKEANGESRPLFHDYEAAHMADCRELILLDGRVSLICLGVSLACVAWAVGDARRWKGRMASLSPAQSRTEERSETACAVAFCRGGLRGMAAAGLAAAGLLIWALVDFDGLFITFHQVAFSNDLWLLNPRTDLLIRLMPQKLFVYLGARGCVIAAAGATVEALLLMFLKSRWKRKEMNRT